MPIDERLAAKLRAALAERSDVEEKKMFGGLAFMVGGHMCCGTLGSEAIFRVGAEEHAAALERPGARVMDFTGRAMTGFVVVSAEALARAATVASWVALAERYVRGLPRKSAGARPGRAKKAPRAAGR